MASRSKNTGLNILCIILAAAIIIFMIYGISIIFGPGSISKIGNQTAENSAVQQTEAHKPSEKPTEPEIRIDRPEKSLDVVSFGEDIISKSAVLINVTDNQIIAERDSEKIIYPASMTKIMTLIVAVENIDSMDDTFTMTYDILAPLIDEEASRAGFEENETVTMRDLIYGAILPSGADGTVGLAVALCGSEDKFVELMNKKADEMGLENTHFTNTSGLHDKQHYTTAVEMAMIVEYAMKNDTCREVLSTYQYTTSKTKEHPQGINLESTLFSRMYGNEVVGARIEGGKTGYTDEAENCLATFGTKNGKEYVTVTTLSYDYWLSVHDAFNIYASYIKPETEIVIVPE